MNIFDAHISGSLSVSSSAQISGDLTVLGTINATISGTTTNALTASEAPKYTLTSSFGSFTSSYTTGSFTGSFKGDGSNLYNIPASGVTGLNLNKIISGSVSASISPNRGFEVNTDATFTGSVNITGSIYLNGNPIGTGKLDETTFNSYTSSITISDNNQNTRLGLLETSTGSLNTFTSSTSGRLTSIEGITGSYATTGSNLFKGTQTHSGSIVPSVDNLYDLGSTTHQWRDVYISSGSLYIDGTKVLGSTSQELTITTDTGQSIKILEAGSDSIILQSADGDIELKSSGGGDILFDPTNGIISIKGTTQIQDGFKITSSGGTNIVFGDSIIVSGSIELTGNVDGIDLQSFSSSVSGKLSSVETSTSSLNTFTSSASGKLTSLESTSGSLNTFTSSASGRLTSLESASGSIRTDFNSFTSSNNSVETTQNNRLDSLQSATGSLNTFTSSASGRLTSLESASGSIRTDFNTFTSSLNGAVEVTGSNLTVKGNLLVKGTTTQIDSTTLNIGDNIIQLNGSGTSNAGLVVQDASGASIVSGSLLWDTAADYWKAGKLDSEDRIILATEFTTVSSSLNSRATSLESASGSIRTDFNTYTGSNDSTNTTQNSRLTSIEGKSGSISLLNTYTGSNNTVIGTLQTSTGSLNTFTSSASSRLTSLESASGSIRTDFNSFTSSNNTTNTTQNSRLTSIEGVTGSIGLLNTYTGSNNTVIGTLQTATSSINTFTSSALTRVTAIETSTGSLNTFTSSASGRLTSIEGKTGSISLLNTYTGSNNTVIGTLQTSTGSLNTFTSSASGRLTSIEGVTGSISSLNTYTGSNNTTNTTQNNRLDSIEGKTGSITLLNTYTGSNDTTNTTQNSRLTSIEGTTGSVSSLNTYTGSNNTVIGTLQTATSSINTFTSSTNTRLGSLETASGSIRSDFNSFTSSNNTVESTQNSRLTSIEGVTGSVSLLNTYTGSNNTVIGTLQTSTSSLNTFTSSASGRLTSLESASSSIRTDFNSFTSSNNSVETTQNGRLTSIEATTGSLTSFTSSASGRLTSIETKTGSYATTGSNVFKDSQTISGSLTITQNLIVLGSSSIQNISSSNLVIGTSIVTLNANSPSARFAGINIIDSGSVGGSGSFLYDAVQDEFIMVHRGNGVNVTSSHFVQGPQTYDSLGNEIYLTTNRLPKGGGEEHIVDSNITDTGTNVSINSDTKITGSLVVTNTIVSQTTPLVSSSGQISYTGITNVPSGIVSGSGQVLSLLPVGVVSGSSQVLNGTTIHSGTFFNGISVVSGSSQISYTGITNVPSGIVSSSAQVLNGSGVWSGSAQLPSGVVSGSSQISYTGITNVPSGLVSGSSQISYTGITNVPTGLVSGSSQVLNGSGVWSGSAQLPTGIVSSSAQTIAGLPSGTVSGSSQVLNGTTIHSGAFFNGITVVSGSGQIAFGGIAGVPSGLVSGSSQVLNGSGVWSGSAQLPSGVVTGSSQIDITGTSNYTTFSSSIATTNSNQDTRLGNLETSTGSLNTFTSSASGRLTSLESASSSIRSDFNSFTSSNNTVESTQNGRLTSLESASGSIRTDFNSFTSSNNTVESTQNGRLTSLEGVTGSISLLNTYTGSNNTVIGTLQTTTSSLNSYTSSNNTTIGTLQTSTSSLNTFTSSFNTAFGLSGADVTVKGNLVISGTTTTINSTTVSIGDNIIQLNGTGATNAGLVVRDATAPNTASGSFLWDTTNDKWIAGVLGSEDDVVLRTTSQTLTNKTINASQLVDLSVTNGKLQNSAITIAGTSTSLGGSISAATILTSTGVWSGSAQLPSGIVSGSYVSSITGTANQVIASTSTGAVTLSLPQSIATTSTPTFGGGTFNGAVGVSATGVLSYGLNITGTAGGARDILLAGLSGFSNGFTVQYNGTSMVYEMRNGNLNVGGTITATNFSGTSSGTNTGDQTNISGTAGNVTGIVAIANGGTGASTASGARTNLGLAIGTDVLAYRTFGTAANSATTDFYSSTNPSNFISGISFANVSSKPTTLSGYGITDSIKSNGTLTGNIDSDWGESFTTFDPVPTGTPPLSSPNIRTVNIGNNFARRTQLAFDYASDVAYFRRRNDSGWQTWREFIHSGNIGSQTVATAGALSSMNISQFTNNSNYITGITFANVTSKPTTLSGYGITDAVPSARSLTINGTAFDLSADRSWTVTASDATKLPTSGGTLTGNLFFSDSGTTKRGIQGTVGANDFWFIGGGATASNAGFLEISTGDDGQAGAGTSEPIYVRQYGPGDPLTGTLVRTATLLDASGNTSFPGTVTAPTFSGALSGNASTATSAGSASTAGYASTAGSAPNGTNLNASYGTTTGAGNGFKFWGGSDLYKIHMGSSAEYYYGPVTDYSIKCNIDSNGSTRGFTWGQSGVTPIAALNVGNGNMQIAGTFTSGGSILPLSNGTLNLGSSSARWNTVFTSDLSLNNGIGDYTIVEGENDLFLYNNKQNKVYKFMLQEVNANDATPKRPE